MSDLSFQVSVGIDVSASGISATSDNGIASDNVFDALNPKGRRRRAGTSLIEPEDLLLTQNRRDRLDSNALDVWRNMSLLAWMIRRTLDYCCLWDFQPQTRDDGLNREWRELMARDCEAENIDYVGRMDWDDMRRVAESLKILTGDAFFVPLSEGTLQMIEGSYCRNPRGAHWADTWVNGAKLNRRGRITAWNFRERKLINRFAEVIDRPVSARNVWQHVQHEGRANQVRGGSSIAAILNECRDIYETFDHARAKVKLDQLFGLVIYRKAGDPDDGIGNQTDAEGNDADTTDDVPDEHYDFGSGPVVMDRDEGEKVELLQSNNPSSQTQEFLKQCIQLALLGLDLPYNFLDSAHTNFFGSRASWNLFERSCHARRQTQLRLHHRMTRWRRLRYVLPTELGGTGELVLPQGMTLNDLRYVWVPRGVPWWKPAEELQTNLQAAASGLKTMQQICDEHGLGLYEENLRQLAREQAEANEHGFVLAFNAAKLSASLQPAGQQQNSQQTNRPGGTD